MNIETNRIIIREFSINDLMDTFEYCSQPGVGETAGWRHHNSKEQTGKILKEWIVEGRKHAIVYRPENKVIGHISIDPDSEENRGDTRELGFVMNKGYHRKGIMSEAVLVVIQELFQSNIKYIWACCFQDNLPSKKLIEKCGFEFQQEGTFYSENLNLMIPSFEYRITRT